MIALTPKQWETLERASRMGTVPTPNRWAAKVANALQEKGLGVVTTGFGGRAESFRINDAGTELVGHLRAAGMT